MLLSNECRRKLTLSGPKGRDVHVEFDEDWLGTATGYPIPLYVGKSADSIAKRAGLHLLLKSPRAMPVFSGTHKQKRPTTSCQVRAGIAQRHSFAAWSIPSAAMAEVRQVVLAEAASLRGGAVARALYTRPDELTSTNCINTAGTCHSFKYCSSKKRASLCTLTTFLGTDALELMQPLHTCRKIATREL